MIAISLVLARYRRANVVLGIAVTLGILVPLFGLPSLFVVLGLESAVPTMFSYFLLASPLLILTAIGLAIRLAFVSRDTRVAKGFALAMGIISVTTAAAVLLPFGVGGDGFLIFYYLVFTTLTALFAFLATMVFRRQLGHRKAVVAAFAGMNGLTVLVFLMWVQLGFGLTFAKISAFVLVALVAIALTNHLKRKQQPGGHGLDQGAKKT